ncbi:copper amine oxidase N-terminal domain-containing protein [Paenibacillus sp. VCA1]|uniref:copper amine oxidase N-terminal domain-containing protein n=1 Tax=Paenibacillus sp. VCA1 TaxID=3039148 RepID=UPI00287113E8|nr:copper amine oxidase N-terminal domain-containing protein [Paenibacillus sp. VCA1]MDR9852063.1 copper amine oxidase N-terminal domain-containing protein [Paenibacillus sp. VCA1]
MVVLKRLVLSMLLSSVLWSACSAYASAEGAVPPTNVAGISIYPYEKGVDAEFYIRYGDSGQESIGKDFVGLFINGSIIKNANVVTENNRTLLPVRIVAEHLGAQIKWDSKAQKVTIADGGQTVELFMHSTHAKVNGKKVDMTVAPKIIHRSTYVPARFVAEALRAKVDYFNGKDLSQPHMVPRLPHVMISRYPSDAKILSKEAAIDKAKKEFVIAYESKFGPFVPLAANEKPGREDDKAILRNVITHLKIESENDRYYVIPMMYDFWVDKYTGDVYTFYNGLTMSINRFDPYAENALSFPG